MSIDTLISFFGWMTLLNVGLIIFSAGIVMIFKKKIYIMHGKLYGIDEGKIAVSLYQMIGVYKILIILFNLVPYIALTLMK